MQLGPVVSHLLDVVVDRIHQLVAVRAVIPTTEDEMTPKPAELSEVRRNVGGRARLRGAVARGTRARPSAARFSAFVIALSKRDAGESQIIDYWWLGIARATASYVRKAILVGSRCRRTNRPTAIFPSLILRSRKRSLVYLGSTPKALRRQLICIRPARTPGS